MPLLIDPIQQQEKTHTLLLSFKTVFAQHRQHTTALAGHFTKKMMALNEAGASLEEMIALLAPMQQVLEEISWSSTEGDTSVLREVIDGVHEMASSMLQNWAELNRFPAMRQTQKMALSAYKSCANNFQEVAQDLESRFFVLPQNDELVNLMQEFSGLDAA